MTTTIEQQRGQEENRRHRLPRKSRLLDEKAYSRVFGNALRSRDTLFTVLYRCGEAGGQCASGPRLGLAISKKNCRLAVGRNRIKRIVRESFRLHQQALQGVDVVVLNNPKTHEATNAALFASLEKHWQKCKSNIPDRAGKGIDG